MDNNSNIKVVRDYVVLMMQYRHVEVVNEQNNIELKKINNSIFVLRKLQKISAIKSQIKRNDHLLSIINKRRELFKSFINIDEDIVSKYLDNCAAFLVLNKRDLVNKYTIVCHNDFTTPSFPLYYTCLNNVQFVQFIRKLVENGYTIRDVDYTYPISPYIDVIGDSTTEGKFTKRLNSLEDEFLSEVIRSDNTITSLTFVNDEGDLFTIHHSGIIMADNFNVELCDKIVNVINKQN